MLLSYNNTPCRWLKLLTLSACWRMRPFFCSSWTSLSRKLLNIEMSSGLLSNILKEEKRVALQCCIIQTCQTWAKYIVCLIIQKLILKKLSYFVLWHMCKNCITVQYGYSLECAILTSLSPSTVVLYRASEHALTGETDGFYTFLMGTNTLVCNCGNEINAEICFSQMHIG